MRNNFSYRFAEGRLGRLVRNERRCNRRLEAGSLRLNQRPARLTGMRPDWWLTCRPAAWRRRANQLIMPAGSPAGTVNGRGRGYDTSPRNQRLSRSWTGANTLVISRAAAPLTRARIGP